MTRFWADFDRAEALAEAEEALAHGWHDGVGTRGLVTRLARSVVYACEELRRRDEATEVQHQLKGK